MISNGQMSYVYYMYCMLLAIQANYLCWTFMSMCQHITEHFYGNHDFIGVNSNNAPVLCNKLTTQILQSPWLSFMTMSYYKSLSLTFTGQVHYNLLSWKMAMRARSCGWIDNINQNPRFVGHLWHISTRNIWIQYMIGKRIQGWSHALCWK